MTDEDQLFIIPRSLSKLVIVGRTEDAPVTDPRSDGDAEWERAHVVPLRTFMEEMNGAQRVAQMLDPDNINNAVIDNGIVRSVAAGITVAITEDSATGNWSGRILRAGIQPHIDLGTDSGVIISQNHLVFVRQHVERQVQGQAVLPLFLGGVISRKMGPHELYKPLGAQPNAFDRALIKAAALLPPRRPVT